MPEFRDAAVGVALILIAREAWQHLRGYVESRFIASDPSLGFGLPSGLDQYLALWNSLSTRNGAIFVPIIAGLVLYYSRVVVKKRLYGVLAGLGVGLIMSGSNAAHFDEFLFELLTFGTSVGFVVAAIVLILRNNLLAYVLLGFASVLTAGQGARRTVRSSLSVTSRYPVAAGSGGRLLPVVALGHRARGVLKCG